jgi:RNA polymerase subunit RPABC4/transcription elongation factor Spt4
MYCMQCGKELPPGTSACPSCTKQASSGGTAVVTAPQATESAKAPINKAVWIIGGIAVLIIIGILAASGGGGKLTTERAQQAVSQWSGGVRVMGVQELPQENAATASLSFSSFNIREQGLFGMSSTRNYSGPGEATFKHFTDGRWVLVKVSTSEAFNSVWWDNLNIQVR